MKKLFILMKAITCILIGCITVIGGVFLWLTSPLPETSQDVLFNNSYFVAHAGGALEGKAYLNSKESLIASLENGYRYVELDLGGGTSDSTLVCIHDWKHFRSITTDDSVNVSDLPMTTEEFKSKKILGKWTPLTLEEAIDIQKTRPFTIVTDKTSDPNVLNRYFKKNRQMVMVESFCLSDYIQLKKDGYIPMMSLWTFSYGEMFQFFVKNAIKYGTKIDWICVHTSSNFKSLRMLKRLFGCKVAMYSSNSANFFKEHLGKEIDLVYTDNWNLKTQKNNDTVLTVTY